MKVVDVRWSPGLGYRGEDVHLLRDPARPSQDLRSMLLVEFLREPGDPAGTPKNFDQTADALDANMRAALDGGAVSFAPQFPFTSAQHGVDVNAVTGVITAQARAAPNRVENFLVKASARPRPTPGNPNPAPHVKLLRFHLHDAFLPDTLRLSPATVTVGRRDAASIHPDDPSGVRFGVLGQFSDGVVASLGNHPDLGWELYQDDASGNPQLVPGGSLPGLTLRRPSGLLVSTGPVQRPVRVKALIPSLNSGGRNAEAFGNVTIGDPWHQPRAARRLAGPGPARRAEVPNLLFLPDGFIAADESLFFEICQNLVRRIRDAPTASPINRLLQQDKLNVFAAFVPSPDSGGTVLYELAYLSDRQFAASTVKLPTDYGSVVLIDALEELVFHVGLPVPNDAPGAGETTAAAAARVRDRLIAIQLALFGTQLSAAKFVELYPQWVRLARRLLAVERDTVFGAQVGARPNADDDRRSIIAFNPFRASPGDLARLVRNVYVTTATNPIGDVWLAKDRTLVVILCAGMPNAGTNVRRTALFREAGTNRSVVLRTVFVGLGRYISPVWVEPVPQTQLVRATLDAPRADPFTQTVGTLLHELAHSLECGDEYNHSDKPFPEQDDDDVLTVGNLTPDRILRGASPSDFTMANALWGFFPRIRAAGVQAVPPQVVPGGHLIRLRSGHGRAFISLPVGTPLRLRLRPLLAAMEARDTTNTLRGAARFAAVLSPPLTLLQLINPADPDAVIVAGLPASGTPFTLPPADPGFPPVLYAPTLNGAGQPLLLTSPPIVQHIETEDAPLNRVTGAACGPQQPDRTQGMIRRPKMIPVNLPAAVASAARAGGYLSKVVGLMDGGRNHACGIFHPTGYCSMDRATDSEFAVPDRFVHVRSGGLLEFCQVCRYVIADYLDPTLHAAIDLDYDRIYPRTP